MIRESRLMNGQDADPVSQTFAWQQWSPQGESTDNPNHFTWDHSVGAAGVTAGLVSVGYVLWALRGGVFVATLCTGLPAWRMIDPTMLLTAYRGSRNLVEDNVERMIR